MNPKNLGRRTSKELPDKGRLPIKNISPFAGKVQHLNCPICGNPQPVSAANIRMRCNICGTPLISMKVKKNAKRKSR